MLVFYSVTEEGDLWQEEGAGLGQRVARGSSTYYSGEKSASQTASSADYVDSLKES